MSEETKDPKRSEEPKSEGPTEDLWDSAHRVWLAGLGALSMAEEEGSKFFRRLVEQGEKFENRSKERLDEVRERAEERIDEMRQRAEDRWGELGSSFDARVTRTLERLGVPSRDQMQELNERIDLLRARIEELEHGDPEAETE